MITTSVPGIFYDGWPAAVSFSSLCRCICIDSIIWARGTTSKLESWWSSSILSASLIKNSLISFNISKEFYNSTFSSQTFLSDCINFCWWVCLIFCLLVDQSEANSGLSMLCEELFLIIFFMSVYIEYFSLVFGIILYWYDLALSLRLYKTYLIPVLVVILVSSFRLNTLKSVSVTSCFWKYGPMMTPKNGIPCLSNSDWCYWCVNKSVSEGLTSNTGWLWYHASLWTWSFSIHSKIRMLSSSDISQLTYLYLGSWVHDSEM